MIEFAIFSFIFPMTTHKNKCFSCHLLLSHPATSQKSEICRGESRGGASGARPPKIGKNMIFWRKIVIFHTKYPKIFAPPSAIGKNMIFWRKIIIFHTKYPKNVHASLRSAQFYKVHPT